MLDEVVNSTVHRCVEPDLMESSVSVIEDINKRDQIFEPILKACSNEVNMLHPTSSNIV